jgi:pimeloyl-ACP methyl ester carboxylesterase
MTEPLDQWWAGGERRTISGRRLFVRAAGSGPSLLLLHGFPASSFEWAALEQRLAARHEVVSFDFLGFGASEKPPGHTYSIFEQTDLTEALLSDLGVEDVTVVAYDYGAIVATEMLARGDARVRRCVLLNAGLFPDQYRPRLTQRLALMPVVGALVARAFNEKVMARTWGEIFSTEHPLDPATAAAHYRALRKDDPAGDVQRRLLRYIPERAAHKERLQDAILRASVPLHFLWGMQDPVSGGAIAAEIQERLPGADLVRYADAGHCPHLEIPERVATDILARTTAD